MRIHRATWLAIGLSWALQCLCMSQLRKAEIKEEVRELYMHGYEGYLKHAWPADELRPLTCGPLLRDPDPSNFGLNDVHGNISMTLLDNLSTLPVVAPHLYPDALERVTTTISFDQDVKVQVFELTIRALGGLLSTYQYLDRLPPEISGQAKALCVDHLEKDLKSYQGRVLEMAVDLATRFLPAFETATGIPYSRINLKRGVESGESQETCAAGAGSLILEFAVLSRLTGDETYELLAHKAYLAIWNRRSLHHLIGNTIGAVHGQWLMPGMSGVGAGIDSFFEYGIKAAILLNDDLYLDVFHDSYAAIQTHVRTSDGFIYRPVQMNNLQLASPSTIDSLGAFLPGMQILAGDLESAIRNHLVFWNLWRRYNAMPESWDWEDRTVVWSGWPGRPEFIEATYYLYKATKDPFYLRVGERVLRDMKRRVKTSCGFATLQDVETGAMEDRMESFVLSETLKYLYLLFDDAAISKPSNTVFTTEGHPLSLSTKYHRRSPAVRKKLHRAENLQCPVYKPPRLNALVVGIEQRPDYDYARSLVYGAGREGVEAERGQVFWREYGYCETPTVPKYSVHVVLTPLDAEHRDDPPLDPSPSPAKVHQGATTGSWMIKDVSGLSLNLRWRLDNTGYDVASIGPHRVRTGQEVIVTDSKMNGYLPVPYAPHPQTHFLSELILRFSAVTASGREVFLHALGTTAIFGRDFGREHGAGWFIGGPPIPLAHPPPRPKGEPADPYGCQLYRHDVAGAVVIVQRGECTFTEKMFYAVRAGAVGVLVIDHPADSRAAADQGLVRPDGSDMPPELAEMLEGAGMVFTAARVGETVNAQMVRGEVEVELLPLEGGAREGEKRKEESGRMREGRLAMGKWGIRNLRIVGGS